MKKRITKILACGMALALMVGTFAFFTDRAEIGGTATNGTFAVGLKAGNADEAKTIADQLLLGGQSGDIENAKTIDNWNPGDSATFSYVVSNPGNKALRAEETLTLKVTAKDGRVFTGTGADSKLTIAGSDGTVITPESTALSEDKTVLTLVYNLDEFALSGKDGATNTEKLTATSNETAAATNGMNAVDATKDNAVRTYTLVFNKAATNEYQNAAIELTVHVDAIQYANSFEDVPENKIPNSAGTTIQQELLLTNETGAAA